MISSKIHNLLKLPLPRLISLASKVRRDYLGSEFEACSIINAKCGLCSEDCKFCAQSSRYSTKISNFPLKEGKVIIEAARRAKSIGAKRFGIVTSGRSVTEKELKEIALGIEEIRYKVGIKVCASLGELNRDNLLILKRAGLSRYHHNIETSPRYFPKIVTTHKLHNRLDTIKAAKNVGLEVCSGGIIGMGEDWHDRIDMALLLKRLNVDSVPINILVPIKGTPFGSLSPLSCIEAIRTISIFRIILKDKIVKIAAGRESVLKDFQALAFMAGANGMLIGGYLTIKGRDVKEDQSFIKEIKKAWRK